MKQTLEPFSADFHPPKHGGTIIKSGKSYFGDAEKAAGKEPKKFTFLSGD
ncbi:hypothetical protein C789_4390 [Microcystis aeruginosa FACHB-905 = DIANCHI905]|uniref:Uncharacterized protein n=1 Tax=Microcystis aeruginosa PCC 7806SL TaxID=1903187 RepID=A0AB33BKR5_MICA7|nr:hypothetical protein BH695_1938 [Microcystis aeruginosa PCC 7806SL]ELS45791.1 hypothetical protein C789_4390 [Microcystis aeruginosa FACHB-905 = DIANCHI905]